MKELDFDELDRAVNSLMGGITKTQPVKVDEEKTLSIDSKLAEGEVPTFDDSGVPATSATDSVSAEQPVEVTPVVNTPSASPLPSAPLAARRGGRFMDVVHPSSDMTKATSTDSAVPGRVSRHGLSIAPISRPVSSARPVAEPAEEKPVMSPVVEDHFPEPETPLLEAGDDVVAATEVESEWPDPLDAQELELNETTATDNSGADDTLHDLDFSSLESSLQEEKEAEDADYSLGSPSIAPQTSPFLSNAVVEKRPLGGIPADTDQEEELSRTPAYGAINMDDDVNKKAKSEAQLPPDLSETGTPLPEELRGDLMAIESDSRSSVEQTAPEVVSPAPVVQKEVPRQDTMTGPSSIAQQYKEEPSTSDQSSGAIFDTDTYHQPLAHPAKKRSGWLWVAGTVVILSIGAGGGAALYFLGLL